MSLCALCGEGHEAEGGALGKLIGPISETGGFGQACYVHRMCALWCPEVYEPAPGRFLKVAAAVRRGRLIKCAHCGQRGATVGCRIEKCSSSYHLKCAKVAGCLFNVREYVIACPTHRAMFEHERNAPPRLPVVAPAARQHIRRRYRQHAVGHTRNHSKRIKLDGEAVNAHIARAAEALKGAKADVAALSSDEEVTFAAKERRQEEFSRLMLRPMLLSPGLETAAQATNGTGAPAPAQAWQPSQGFESVGGLQAVVHSLREMVLLPLIYPGLFRHLGIRPPRGILLHGAPGTGKTHVVRALAGECAKHAGRPVALFARKGADCLGKYAGDAEKTLRLLFDEAAKHAPSIVFLDELDALLPPRSTREGTTDQIFASVTATMLSLLDGLSDRGQVVVVGATNRPEGIDPAMRRPGRFDREVHFPLPSAADRLAILKVFTADWQPGVPQSTLEALAAATEGFAGADLRALCSEAALVAFRRAAPGGCLEASLAAQQAAATQVPQTLRTARTAGVGGQPRVLAFAPNSAARVSGDPSTADVGPCMDVPSGDAAAMMLDMDVDVEMDAPAVHDEGGVQGAAGGARPPDAAGEPHARGGTRLDMAEGGSGQPRASHAAEPHSRRGAYLSMAASGSGPTVAGQSRAPEVPAASPLGFLAALQSFDSLAGMSPMPGGRRPRKPLSLSGAGRAGGDQQRQASHHPDASPVRGALGGNGASTSQHAPWSRPQPRTPGTAAMDLASPTLGTPPATGMPPAALPRSQPCPGTSDAMVAAAVPNVRSVPGADKCSTPGPIPASIQVQVQRSDWLAALRRLPPPCAHREVMQAAAEQVQPVPAAAAPLVLPDIRQLLQALHDSCSHLPPLLAQAAAASVDVQRTSMDDLEGILVGAGAITDPKHVGRDAPSDPVEAGASAITDPKHAGRDAPTNPVEAGASSRAQGASVVGLQAGLTGSQGAVPPSAPLHVRAGGKGGLQGLPQAVPAADAAATGDSGPISGGNGSLSGVLLCGDDTSAQHVAMAALLKLTDGATLATVSLPGMLHHGHGDVTGGAVQLARQALSSCKPGATCVLHLPLVDAWAVDWEIVSIPAETSTSQHGPPESYAHTRGDADSSTAPSRIPSATAGTSTSQQRTPSQYHLPMVAGTAGRQHSVANGVGGSGDGAGSAESVLDGPEAVPRCSPAWAAFQQVLEDGAQRHHLLLLATTSLPPACHPPQLLAMFRGHQASPQHSRACAAEPSRTGGVVQQLHGSGGEMLNREACALPPKAVQSAAQRCLQELARHVGSTLLAAATAAQQPAKQNAPRSTADAQNLTATAAAGLPVISSATGTATVPHLTATAAAGLPSISSATGTAAHPQQAAGTTDWAVAEQPTVDPGDEADRALGQALLLLSRAAVQGCAAALLQDPRTRIAVVKAPRVGRDQQRKVRCSMRQVAAAAMAGAYSTAEELAAAVSAVSHRIRCNSSTCSSSSAAAASMLEDHVLCWATEVRCRLKLDEPRRAVLLAAALQEQSRLLAAAAAATAEAATAADIHATAGQAHSGTPGPPQGAAAPAAPGAAPRAEHAAGSPAFNLEVPSAMRATAEPLGNCPAHEDHPLTQGADIRLDAIDTAASQLLARFYTALEQALLEGLAERLARHLQTSQSPSDVLCHFSQRACAAASTWAAATVSQAQCKQQGQGMLSTVLAGSPVQVIVQLLASLLDKQ